MSIVITGATGQLGRMIIADLLDAKVPADQIRAVARSAERAADLVAKGIQLHVADYDRPETLAGAFGPKDRVLLISGTEVGRRMPQHAAVIDAAREVGVAQLAYTGVFGGPKANFRLADEHRETEQRIRETGLTYTFLRNNWYTDASMFTGGLTGIIERGAIVNSVSPDARLATAPRVDYAAAASVVLNHDGHLNKAYELSGDTEWTFGEFAEELSRQTGKRIVHQSVSPSEHKAILTGAGAPEDLADILVDVDAAISRGALSGGPGDLSRLIGRRTIPLAESIAEALGALGR
ncbi:SDR family oxidoreductase [Rugosimonospora africana]|uniref:NAD(P)-dependent oxidoreductase n=1 Tax=Rugosimonospora africana TaxID=556532 RepID=A0A8J3VRS5_9ACTN|nr:SDR family oxidoreductase [Rugosimonospora africana]GIH16467.1 NAD(P)-dependent oxidoreductase [Rugosimonospora africana]